MTSEMQPIKTIKCEWFLVILHFNILYHADNILIQFIAKYLNHVSTKNKF